MKHNHCILQIEGLLAKIALNPFQSQATYTIVYRNFGKMFKETIFWKKIK